MNTIKILIDFIFYVGGWSLHITKRATVAKKTKRNTLRLVQDFVQVNMINLCVRLFISTAAVIAWEAYPMAITNIAHIFASHIPDSGWVMAAVKEVLMQASIKPNILMCGLLGYVADSLLDWVGEKSKKVREELPPLQDAPRTQIMDMAQITALVGDKSTKAGKDDDTTKADSDSATA